MAHRDQDIRHPQVQAFITADPNNLEEFLSRNPVWRRQLLRHRALNQAKAWFEQGVTNNNSQIQIDQNLWVQLVDALEAVILARDPELLAVQTDLNYERPV